MPRASKEVKKPVVPKKTAATSRTSTVAAVTPALEKTLSRWTKADLIKEVMRLSSENANLAASIAKKEGTILGKRGHCDSEAGGGGKGGGRGKKAAKGGSGRPILTFDDDDDEDYDDKWRRLMNEEKEEEVKDDEGEEKKEESEEEETEEPEELPLERKEELAHTLEKAQKRQSLLASSLSHSYSTNIISPEGASASSSNNHAASSTPNKTLPLVDVMTSVEWGLLGDSIILHLGPKELRRLSLCNRRMSSARPLDRITACSIGFEETSPENIDHLLSYLESLVQRRNSLVRRRNSRDDLAEAPGSSQLGLTLFEGWRGLRSLNIKRVQQTTDAYDYLQRISDIVRGSIKRLTLQSYLYDLSTEEDECVKDLVSMPSLRVMVLKDVRNVEDILAPSHAKLKSLSICNRLSGGAKRFSRSIIPEFDLLLFTNSNFATDARTANKSCAHALIQATPKLEILRMDGYFSAIPCELYEVPTERKKAGQSGWEYMRQIQPYEHAKSVQHALDYEDVEVRMKAINAGALPSIDSLYLRCKTDSPAVLPLLSSAWKAGHLSKIKQLYISSSKDKKGDLRGLVETWMAADNAAKIVSLTLELCSEVDLEFLLKQMLAHPLLPHIRQFEIGGSLGRLGPSLLLQALRSGWAANLERFSWDQFCLGDYEDNFLDQLLCVLEDGKLPSLTSLDLSVLCMDEHSHPKLVPALCSPFLSSLISLSLNGLNLSQDFLIPFAEALTGRRKVSSSSAQEEKEDESSGNKQRKIIKKEAYSSPCALERLAKLELADAQLSGADWREFFNILVEARRDEGIIALPSLYTLDLSGNSFVTADEAALLEGVLLGGALPKLTQLRLERVPRRLENLEKLSEVGERDRPKLWKSVFK